MTQASVTRGSPHTHTHWSGQQSHSWAAATHARVSALRCCVWVLEAAGLSAAWAAATSSPHAITTGQRGTARRPGGYRSAQLHPAMPCGRESLAVTSGDKAPYGDGEGRRLATARGRLGEGSGGGGSSCAHPGVLHVQLLPLTRAYIQQRRELGVPRPAVARPLRSPCWGERAAACGPGHAPGNTMSWAGLPGREARGLESVYPV